MQLRERDFDAFFDAPFHIHGSTSNYVSTMRSDLERFLAADRNPLFESDEDFTFFTLHDGDRIIGRVVAHHHPASNAAYGTRMGYFGFFECIDDVDAARMLLGAAEAWSRNKGYDTIEGNFNLSAMQQIGVQTEGFERAPYVDQITGAPWLPKLLEANGYQARFPMRTFEVALKGLKSDALLGPKQRAILEDPEWTFPPINRLTISDRLKDALVTLNDGFAHNPMFVPLTPEEFDFQAKELKWVVDPRIAVLLHHKGQPAATALIIPDLNPFIKASGSRLSWRTPWHYVRYLMSRKRALAVYMSVRQDLQAQGVAGVLLHEALKRLQSAGYEQLGITWVWDENRPSLRQIEAIGAQPLHRLHLFRKQLA